MAEVPLPSPVPPSPESTRPNPLVGELHDMAARYRSDYQNSPTKKELDRLKKAPGIKTAVMGELVAGVQTKDYRRAWDAIQWFGRLDIKIPDKQLKQDLPQLARECEDAMNTQRINYKPKQRGIVRRRVLQGVAATSGLFAVSSTAKVAYDVMNYGRHTKEVEALQSSPTPEVQVNNFNDLIKPVIDEVNKRRVERAKAEPEYDQVVDKELNQNLINIGMVAWSEGHGESLTVLSYNRVTGEVTSVSCTRETVTPTVNRYLDKNFTDKSKDPFRGPFATNMFLYHAGGFELMRRVIEEETGLSSDLQVYISDTMLHDFIERVLGNSLEIEVKSRLHLKPHTFNKWQYTPEGYFLDPGKHKMNADEALSYVLSSDAQLMAGKGNQPPGRKNDLIMAVFSKTMDQLRRDPVATLTAIGGFMNDKLPRGEIAADFNIAGLITAVGYRATLAKLRGVDLKPPTVNKTDLMLNDEFFGDGGMIRVNRLIDEKNLEPKKYQEHAHPNVQKLIDQTIAMSRILNSQGIPLDDPERGLLARGVLPVWLQVPIQGDPQAANLVTGYWSATRQLTKQRLLK